MPFDNMTFNEVLAYIAGFFDGEGTFCFRKAQATRPVPAVCAVQKDVAVLLEIKDFLMRAFGIDVGVYYIKSNRCWSLAANKRKDVLLLCSVLYPYLIVKKKQAAGLIEFINLRLEEGRSGTDNVDKENELVSTVCRLNGGRFYHAGVRH